MNKQFWHFATLVILRVIRPLLRLFNALELAGECNLIRPVSWLLGALKLTGEWTLYRAEGNPVSFAYLRRQQVLEQTLNPGITPEEAKALSSFMKGRKVGKK